MLKLSLAFLLFGIATANVWFNRTIKASGAKGNLKISGTPGCAAHDDWGANDCTFNWGTSISGAVDTFLDTPISSGKLVVNMMVEKVLPFKFTCPVCGANCTFTIPIIKQKVTFALLPCPLSSPFHIEIPTTALPDKSPFGPIKISVEGSVEIHDQTGKTVIHVDVEASANGANGQIESRNSTTV